MRDVLIIAGIIAAGLAILAGTMNLPLLGILSSHNIYNFDTRFRVLSASKSLGPRLRLVAN